MSTQDGGVFPDTGSRLKQERKRLSLSQEALCTILGIKDPKTLRSWESGTTAPDMSQLVVLMENSFDVAFVLTGRRDPAMLVAQSRADYVLPAQRVAAEIAGLPLEKEDAEILLALARRLSHSK